MSGWLAGAAVFATAYFIVVEAADVGDARQDPKHWFLRRHDGRKRGGGEGGWAAP